MGRRKQVASSGMRRMKGGFLNRARVSAIAGTVARRLRRGQPMTVGEAMASDACERHGAGHSKKVETHMGDGAFHDRLQLRPHSQEASCHARDGRWIHKTLRITPAM